MCKNEFGSYEVFTEQESLVRSRLPGCSGQAGDAVSAYTEVKMEDAPS